MTWSYSGDPSKNARDQVRFLIQDTQETDQFLSDAEIDYLLTAEGNTRTAAARAAEIIGGQFARKCDESVGQVRISFSQKSKQYWELALRLKRDAAIKGACPFAGGISRADKETRRSDENRVRPDFIKSLHDIHNHEIDHGTNNILVDEGDL